MKKLFALFLFATLLIGCSSDDDNNKDEFSQRQVTASELESGTATYKQGKGTKTYYLVFKDGALTSWEYQGGEFTNHTYYKYEIKGDSLYLTKEPYLGEILDGDTQYYTLYINMVHWGYDKTTDSGTGGDQLLIRGDNVQDKLATGYYDSSSISLKL